MAHFEFYETRIKHRQNLADKAADLVLDELCQCINELVATLMLLSKDRSFTPKAFDLT